MTKSEQRVLIVTGVTRGLGRAMAERFIEMGHTVVGCGRSKDAVAELRTAHSPPNSFSTVDVSDNGQVSRWAKRMLADVGPPDVLVNNAAIINRSAPLWDVPAGEFSEVIDTNIKGVTNVIRHFLPAMLERREGVIVNFSSGWGRSTDADVAPYCATKWAIEGLTLALAQELPRGMAAVPLNPGIIDTEMLRSCFGSSAGHYPDAQDWSRRAAWFILSLNGQHNGQQLTVAK